MSAVSIRAAAASLFAIAIAGCTTTGMGTGQSTKGNLGATFVWKETGGTRGTMVASLTNGQVFQGPMFQITQESRVMDYGPLWNGWGPGFGWGGGWGGRRWGRGWGGWGPWGPKKETLTPYNRQGPSQLQRARGFLRCPLTPGPPSPGHGRGGGCPGPPPPGTP